MSSREMRFCAVKLATASAWAMVTAGSGLAQQAALGFGVGPVSGRPERLHPLAVGFDQGDVDPVERGAAHQTDCRQHHRHSAFAAPCS
jgi:hypothetical protein